MLVLFDTLCNKHFFGFFVRNAINLTPKVVTLCDRHDDWQDFSENITASL